KRGDNRKPIYLECAATGLTFHPDRLTVTSGSLGREQLRAEVEKRIARYGTTPSEEGKPKKNAYLLLLLRPEGITTYYDVQSALQGFDVDFGYEFIDSDWVLDFPEDGPDFRTQPWMAGDKKPTTPTPAVATPSPSGPPRPLQGLPHESASSSGIRLPVGAT